MLPSLTTLTGKQTHVFLAFVQLLLSTHSTTALVLPPPSNHFHLDLSFETTTFNSSLINSLPTHVTDLSAPSNQWPPSHSWPRPPFDVHIPKLIPPSALHFQSVTRSGGLKETISLLSAINDQIDRYHDEAGLPSTFLIEKADVLFSMRRGTPKEVGKELLSLDQAIGALETFGKLVELGGARECIFVVQTKEGVKAFFWVAFPGSGADE